MPMTGPFEGRGRMNRPTALNISYSAAHLFRRAKDAVTF
ncbi:hypothetical protein CUJ84_Chr004797 [Rhizobium leguminosarum]|uniref:Uncharacterized protein n=1 Tax=Rhizobium leguminosarum TaxID=384 RepID=A0A2K9ZA42_RHILE|nr:hypothetical protein CUJ84_Chr004797 [Rhizobium leguminosarum]